MPIGFNSSLDLFHKVERDKEDLISVVTPDTFFNFVVTAHSLVDWVKNDRMVSEKARQECKKLAKNDQWLLACRELANGSKHFFINRSEPIVEKVEAFNGYGKGRYGTRDYGQGEWSITVSWDGKEYTALEFAEPIVSIWAAFFENYYPNNS
jgi:hypothetical protein